MEHRESASPAARAEAAVLRNAEMMEPAKAGGFYVVECIGPDGKLKWRDTIKNLVTDAGANDNLDKYLAGSGYTAAWYLGLVNSSPSFNAADTMASHAGWTENTNYSNSTRVAPSFGSASSRSKAASAAAFNINSNAQTIAGCFLTTVSTKGGTTGILYSCGSFSGGNKTVDNGDVLNVTYTATLT